MHNCEAKNGGLKGPDGYANYAQMQGQECEIEKEPAVAPSVTWIGSMEESHIQ